MGTRSPERGNRSTVSHQSHRHSIRQPAENKAGQSEDNHRHSAIVHAYSSRKDEVVLEPWIAVWHAGYFSFRNPGAS